MLTPCCRPNPTIRSGKFGRCGKMVIKPYSVPTEKRSSLLKIFRRFVKLSICGCWEWCGRVHNGYGVFPAPGGSKWAHRVVYALFNGPIEAQRHIDHRCRNPLCVNPAHLKQVTPIENYEAIQRRKHRREKQARESAGQLTLWKSQTT